jgi:hypothetical protein
MEFKAAALSFQRQVGVPLYYKGELISEHRPDLVVADVSSLRLRALNGSRRFTSRGC